PRPTPVPTPRPTPVPTPRPTPRPTPTPAFGTVNVGRSFVSYTVSGDRITGFRTVDVESGFQARSTAPSTYRFASFSDPNGTKVLVRIVSGPYADVYVSPGDPGVRFQTGG
ncbi:MAG: hypothetical protein LH650_04625, partial [Chloroflexi bacterium]|nr:hypothetical protein [Chloroflexota bacterium]